MVNFLGVDLGTTNARSIIFNEKGEVLGQAFKKLTLFNPQSDFAEQNPEEIWVSMIKTIKDCVKGSKLSANEIVAISFSARMHGMMMLDREGTPLTHLLTWLDRRATSQTNTVNSLIDSYTLYNRTGCPQLFIYPFIKILWIRENMPRIFEKCSKILSAKDYVIYRMLGEAFIDRSLASGTQLLNIHRLEWDETILELSDITADHLPTLVNETEVIGELPIKIAKLTGLQKGIPIFPGGSDGALNNIGLGATKEGITAMNLGTSGALRVVTNKPYLDKDQEAHFFCYYAGQGHWLPGGAISNAGILLRWFKDNFGQQEIDDAKKFKVDPYDLLLKKAASIPLGSDGLLMLPFFSGERFPINDPKARGLLFGLTLSHGKAHIIRSILESIVFTIRWIMESIQEHGAKIDEVRVGGGGARSSVWRQIQSDILGKLVVHTKVEESSASGAAMLAAVGLGIYLDLDEASNKMIKTAGRHEPNLSNYQKYGVIFKLYKDFYFASKKFSEELSRIITINNE
jgi:gluconokinase